MRVSAALSRCNNIEDLRKLAFRRLPSPLFHFLDGGSETEITLQRNTAAFDDVQLLPRCLVDVSSIDTSTRILGQDVQWPVFCSPTGASRLFDADGELAVARAAAQTGSSMGSPRALPTAWKTLLLRARVRKYSCCPSTRIVIPPGDSWSVANAPVMARCVSWSTYPSSVSVSGTYAQGSVHGPRRLFIDS